MVGLAARGWSDLPERLRATIQYADVLLGSRRLIDLIPPFPAQQRLPWPSPLREALPMLLKEISGHRVVALASGDPLLAGIGSTLVEILGTAEVRIHPAVSSAALARARMGWPEESTQLVRLRGGDVDAVRRFLFPDRRLIILSSNAGSMYRSRAHMTRGWPLGTTSSPIISSSNSFSPGRRPTNLISMSPAIAVSVFSVKPDK